MLPPPTRSPLFPYTTLFRSDTQHRPVLSRALARLPDRPSRHPDQAGLHQEHRRAARTAARGVHDPRAGRLQPRGHGQAAGAGPRGDGAQHHDPARPPQRKGPRRAGAQRDRPPRAEHPPHRGRRKARQARACHFQDHGAGGVAPPQRRRACDAARAVAEGGPLPKDMNKAFTKERDDGDDEDDDLGLPALPTGTKNYITPAGYRRLRGELMTLLDDERPKVVEAVSWAAKNGDRSENGDYIYGKKRLREIDRRIRFLTKRLDIAEVADPTLHHGSDQIFFGATVTYANSKGEQRTITIKGIDEVDNLHGE